jgi:hypothetical protein
MRARDTILNRYKVLLNDVSGWPLWETIVFDAPAKLWNHKSGHGFSVSDKIKNWRLSLCEEQVVNAFFSDSATAFYSDGCKQRDWA